ncbi:MAG: TldD/PmbA family protein [Thermoplasmata archaeon]|nr:TldD/PmbA family protein [Thermoplasmata archaeon]
MQGLAGMEPLADRLLRSIEPRTPYAEILYQSSSGEVLRYDRSATAAQPIPRFEGMVLRAWSPRGWVEVSTSGSDPERWRTAAEELIVRLGYGGGAKDPPGAPATGSADRSSLAVRPMAELPTEARLALAKTWFGWATSVDGIRNAYAIIESRTDERWFHSTTGARRHQRIERARGSILALAIENGKIEYDFVGRGGIGGSELLDTMTEERIVRTATEAKALLAARAAPTGRMTVLLDPSTAGTFAHESFGHGAEADQILRDRSYLKPLLGTTVGPECLTLVDDGSLAGGWGSIFFDDEGHETQRTVLVDHGKFVNVLQDREAAAALGRKATGNTRRADFLSRPFVRMTNTLVEPGAEKREGLLSQVRDGVLLESCTSGIEDPQGGNMQIKVKKGHRIRHGEVGEILPSMALSGRVLDFLKSIRGVSGREDFELSPGYCGKGHTDILPTGTGGPFLLAEATVGPA